MQVTKTFSRQLNLFAVIGLIIAVLPLSAFAQGSIFGTVQNADLSTPANGEISFFGYLDDTDEEIRIETSTGAGYDAGNWFDDFQNYLTEAPGNPYDYHFYNIANSEGFHLAKLQPSNSFQEENIVLAAITWPAQPTGLTATSVSTGSVVVSWTGVTGNTYHVYRRLSSSTGSFFRLDDPNGSLANPGVADSFFVDTTVDGSSSYDYLIIAEDGSGNLSQHSAVVTVNSSTPSAPVVNSISPDSGLTIGGTLVNIYGSGFDMAGADAVVGTASLTGITVVSPFHLTGTTQAGTAGTADVSVTNTASALASNTLTGAFTYVANSAPVLDPIGPQSVTEGNPLVINTSATDADGGFPIMTSSTLPGTATYVDNGDGTGTFNWTPGFTEAGTYNVTFYATDDVEPTLVDSEQVVITVNEAGNQDPVLDPIGSQTTAENVQLTFGVTASDPDGTIPALTTSTLPGTATFVDNGDGTGTFDWTPGFTDAGTYPVTFYAGDGTATDSEIVTITVTDAGNQPPVLAPIGPQSTTENIQLTFGVSASDADGTTPALTTSTLPGTATFVDNGDGTGTFDWTPSYVDAGTYQVTFYASDGVDTDSEQVAITVIEAGNQNPVLTPIGAQVTTEGVQLIIPVSGSDPESIPALTTSSLPIGATFVDNGDGTGNFDWIPGYTQAGSYDVTFYATDDSSAVDSELVTITVNEAGNQAPVLDSIGPKTTSESVQLTFIVTANDPDSTIPVLSTSTPLPGTATFVDNGDGTGTFDWTPTLADSGSYNVTFYADDGALNDSEIVVITVTNANQEPVLDPIGPQSINEGSQLTFGVSASDADGDIPTLSTSTLPGTATFIDNGDGTGTFDWTPSSADSGVHLVTFYATDAMYPTSIDSEIVTITVNNVNQLPVLNPIGTQQVVEGDTMTFTTSASDPDGDIPLLTSSTLPGTATYIDNGNGTGSFNWVTTALDAGAYSVTFYATDALFPSAVDSEVVTLIVGETGNQPPTWTTILNDTAVSENDTLILNVAATDPEGNNIELSVNTLIEDYTFIDNGDGTGVFTYMPNYTDAGVDSVRFVATDDGSPQLSTVMSIAITTIDVNQPPVIDTVGPFGIEINDTLIFTITASDTTDTTGASLILTALDIPTNAQFIDNGDNTGIFTFSPVPGQEGIDTVTFLATDNGFPQATGSLPVEITVVTVNFEPVLDSIGPKQVNEGETLAFTITGSDPDGTIPFFEALNQPDNSTFTDNGDGTADFVFNPSYLQSGLYYVTFRANDGMDIDKEVVLIQVAEAGDQAPQFTFVPFDTVMEGDTLGDSIIAVDPEGDPITLEIDTATVVPPHFNFTDNGDGSGIFVFLPDFTQSGTYNITLIATANGQADTAVLTIVVSEFGNHDPVLDTIPDYTVTELTNLNFTVTATDIDGDIPLMTASPLPGAATYSDQGNGTGVFSWTPLETDSGTYQIMFYAEDGAFSGVFDSQLVTITVADTNRVPWIYVPFGQPDTVSEGATFTYTVTTWDDDGPTPSLEAFLDGSDTLASNMTFYDSGNGTGVLTFNPDYTQGDDNPTLYYVVFLARDSVDTSLTATTGGSANSIKCYNTPLPPVMIFSDSTWPFTINEGDTLAFTVMAIDPDNAGIPTVWAENLPPTNVDTSTSVNTLSFEFRPDFTQSGTYQISFIARDVDLLALADTQVIDITVLESGNHAPSFSTVLDSQTLVYIGIEDTTELAASDVDGDALTLTASDTLTGATLIDNGDGTGRYIYTPDPADLGQIFLVSFYVTDASGAADTIWTQYGVAQMKRGDVDSNGKYSMNDISFLANYIFRGGPEPMPMEAGDADMNGAIEVADIVYMVNFLYNAGPRPPQ